MHYVNPVVISIAGHKALWLEMITVNSLSTYISAQIVWCSLTSLFQFIFILKQMFNKCVTYLTLHRMWCRVSCNFAGTHLLQNKSENFSSNVSTNYELALKVGVQNCSCVVFYFTSSLSFKQLYSKNFWWNHPNDFYNNHKNVYRTVP